LLETIHENEAIEKQNSVDSWRDSEIKSLGIFVIEKRLEALQN